MGRVWRAHDETLDRTVAIKEIVLPEGLPPDERLRMLERVKREARLAARLHHPGIVGVHDIIDRGGAPVIVMEFIDGPSLATWIREHGPLPWRNVVNMAVAVLDALSHAHAAGIVHRDLKPDNIVISGNRAVLTDFGIARLLDGNTALTAPGTVLGTPSYMAPEQIEGREVTTASDLWSLGATLYAAVEGRPPFAGQTMTEVCIAILTQPLPPPRNAGGLEPVLTALLVKDPAARATATWTSQHLASLNGAPAVVERNAPTAVEPNRSDVPGPAQPAAVTYKPGQDSAQPPPFVNSPVPSNLAQPPTAGHQPVQGRNQQPQQAQPVQQWVPPSTQQPVATTAAWPIEPSNRLSRLGIVIAGVLAMVSSVLPWERLYDQDAGSASLYAPTNAFQSSRLFWEPLIVIGLLALAAIVTRRPWAERLGTIIGPLCMLGLLFETKHFRDSYSAAYTTNEVLQIGFYLGIAAAAITTLCGLIALPGARKRRPPT